YRRLPRSLHLTGGPQPAGHGPLSPAPHPRHPDDVRGDTRGVGPGERAVRPGVAPHHVPLRPQVPGADPVRAGESRGSITFCFPIAGAWARGALSLILPVGLADTVPRYG